MIVGTPGVSMRLASVRTDGTDYREVPGIERPLLYSATWSRNGARIAFLQFDASLPPARQYSVWICNADGSGLREIGDGHSPALSADGTRLAYLFNNVVDAPGTPGGSSSWVGLTALVVDTGAAAFDTGSRMTGAYYAGAAAPYVAIANPRWAGNRTIWADYMSSGPASPTTHALKRYLDFPGTVMAARQLAIPVQDDQLTYFIVNDFSPDGDVGLVTEGIGRDGEVRVSWLDPDGGRRTLKSRSRSGGGQFSPDGQRLWINMDDGRGARFIWRDGRDAGAPGPLPSSYSGYIWYQG